MKLKPHQSVPIDVAETRALAAPNHLFEGGPLPASSIADKIWPDHSMKAQGAGAAASRVLVRLRERNLARWTVLGGRWGWVKN